MKVKKLIEELMKLEQDADVMVLQSIPGSQHYSESGSYEYELSNEFKVRVVTEDWIELV